MRNANEGQQHVGSDSMSSFYRQASGAIDDPLCGERECLAILAGILSGPFPNCRVASGGRIGS